MVASSVVAESRRRRQRYRLDTVIGRVGERVRLKLCEITRGVPTRHSSDGNLSPTDAGGYIRPPVINQLLILRRQTLRPVTALCLLAGLLFGLSFPCHPDLAVAFLFHPVWAWIAWIPLLLVLHSATSKASAFRRGWTAGFVGNLICLYWVGYTQGGGPAVIAGAGLAAAYLAVFTGLFAMVQFGVIRRWGTRGVLAAPVLWTAVEYLMSLGQLGFPWLLLGHSQADVPALIQAASLTGVYGISFAVVAVSACLSLAILDNSLRIPGCVTGVMIVGTLYGTGWWTLSQALIDEGETVGIGLIQNNLGRVKWRPGGLQKSIHSLDSLSREALSKEHVDLLIWPETAVPCDLSRRASCRRSIQSLADEFDVRVLTGAPGIDKSRGEPLNAVYYVQPNHDTLLTYAKMHLVPFGERTPYLDAIPGLRNIDWTALTGDLAPAQFARGQKRTLFPIRGDSDRPTGNPGRPLGNHRKWIGPLVCFESVFPDLVRRHVAQGAELLVIITNDSWFGATSGPFQHAQIAAMRAVENRRPIARCATNGVSLFVDAYGRSTAHTQFGTTAVNVGSVALHGAEPTFYTRYGDWFAQICLALGVLALFALRFYAPASDGGRTAHGGSTSTDDTLISQDNMAVDDGRSDAEPAREMPFLDHLEELRWRLLKAIGALLVGAAVCFAYADPLLHLLTQPYEQAVISLQQQNSPGPATAIRLWVEELRVRVSDSPVESSDQSVDQPSGESSGTTVVDSADVPSVEGEGEDSKQVLPYRRQLQSLRVMTWFIVSLQVALLGGLILASPIVFYQLWRFVAPGLLNRERRLVLPIIGLSVFCFLLGAAVAHQIVLPLGLRFFLSLEPADMISQWAVDEYIGFVLRLLLGFGVVFEMPVVSLFLSRLGLLTPDYLRRVRRYAVVGIFLVAAVFTPPDPISQLLMALPLMVLYEISIGVSHLAQRKPVSFDDDDDDPESEPPPPSDDDERAGPPDTLT